MPGHRPKALTALKALPCYLRARLRIGGGTGTAMTALPNCYRWRVSGARMALRANRDGRRNHAADVTCHVWKWINSNYGMITEADVDDLRGHGRNWKHVYKQ